MNYVRDLFQLFQGVPVLSMFGNAKGSSSREVSQLSDNSKKVDSGTIFFAVKGLSRDGHDFLLEVCEKKPLAIVAERVKEIPSSYKGYIFQVAHSKLALHQVAQKFFGYPDKQLKVFGVTGTNGKTTTTHILEALLNGANIPCAVMGTIDHHLHEKVWPTQMTTPDTLDFYSRLDEFLQAGAQAVAMEVSSHSLKQNRLHGVQFDGALFTNLSRDHLDYHGTMEDYFLSKLLLFRRELEKSSKNRKFAFINGDDPQLQGHFFKGNYETFVFGEKSGQITFEILEQSFEGLKLEVQTPWGKGPIHVPMIGKFNAKNVVGALSVALSQGVSFNSIQKTLSGFSGVRGRLQRVPCQKDIHVFVDYAHTDDALAVVLKALNQVRDQLKSSPRIITVFGCGGDRDKGKRPLMAQRACEGSDYVVVTSDNPRSEDPQKIIAEIMTGLDTKIPHKIEEDRRAAIEWALNEASIGDVVLIAGKGHENYQIIGNEKIHFDDAEVVKEFRP